MVIIEQLRNVLILGLLMVAIVGIGKLYPDSPNANVPVLTDRDIYENPFIKQIRIGLDSYLNASNNGLENEAVTGIITENTDMECGLDNFDKSYYKSKFIIWSSEHSKYGGRNADIVFVDKPDTIFWVWIYNLGDNNKPNYVLRAFCKNGPNEETRIDFSGMIQSMLKDGKFPYTL